MKLRVRGNSLRLRLTQSEVKRIAQGESLEEEVSFGVGPSFCYRLEPSRETHEITATYRDHLISIQIPWETALRWSASEQISIDSVQKNGKEESLKILIEKDFFCLKPRSYEHEIESDLFANPNQVHGTCAGK